MARISQVLGREHADGIYRWKCHSCVAERSVTDLQAERSVTDLTMDEENEIVVYQEEVFVVDSTNNHPSEPPRKKRRLDQGQSVITHGQLASSPERSVSRIHSTSTFVPYERPTLLALANSQSPRPEEPAADVESDSNLTINESHAIYLRLKELFPARLLAQPSHISTNLLPRSELLEYCPINRTIGDPTNTAIRREPYEPPTISKGVVSTTAGGWHTQEDLEQKWIWQRAGPNS